MGGARERGGGEGERRGTLVPPASLPPLVTHAHTPAPCARRPNICVAEVVLLPSRSIIKVCGVCVGGCRTGGWVWVGGLECVRKRVLTPPPPHTHTLTSAAILRRARAAQRLIPPLPHRVWQPEWRWLWHWLVPSRAAAPPPAAAAGGGARPPSPPPPPAQWRRCGGVGGAGGGERVWVLCRQGARVHAPAAACRQRMQLAPARPPPPHLPPRHVPTAAAAAAAATALERATPCVFTSITPAWNNENLNRLANKLESGLVFAHVRAAYPGESV